MPDNSFGLENTIDQSVAARGYWEEMPIPLAAFSPATVGQSGLKDIPDTTATGFTRMLTLLDSGGTVTAGGSTARHILSMCLPQLTVGAATLLQALNSASAGDGPNVEVQVLARSRDVSGNAAVNGILATVTWLEGYVANTPAAAWKQRSGTTAVGALPAGGVALPADFRWITIPLLQPSVPTSGSTNTATERDNLALTLKNNNYPLPFHLALMSAADIAATDAVDIAAVNLRWKRHAGNRWAGRGNGFSNGGLVGVATGINPTFPAAAVSATPAVF